MTSTIKAVDLFCGCGGISLGLQMAGVEVIAGVDVEETYICSFENNFKSAQSLKIDLSKTSPTDFMDFIKVKRGELSFLSGGPPCQGFSKNVPRKEREMASANNNLVNTYLNYCEAMMPQFILMENVAEMKNGFDQHYTEQIMDRLEKAGYNVIDSVLNAADYGVPQTRRRAFFLAARDGVKLRFPLPTHMDRKCGNDLFGTPHYVTVWEAIGDLPSLEHGEGGLITHYATEAISEYQRLMRNSDGCVGNHIARRLSPVQHKRLSSIGPGEGIKHLPADLRPKAGYSGAYGRLTKDMVCPTITRWVFHPGSGRFGHFKDIRTITMREAARIQGFPDYFNFVGTYTQQAGQIGNAVPPLLVRTVADAVLRQAGIAWRRRTRRSHAPNVHVAPHRRATPP